MTTQGYVNLSIKPDAKRMLELMALDLSKEIGRRVTLSEALEWSLTACTVHEIDVAEGQKYTTRPPAVDRG